MVGKDFLKDNKKLIIFSVISPLFIVIAMLLSLYVNQVTALILFSIAFLISFSAAVLTIFRFIKWIIKT